MLKNRELFQLRIMEEDKTAFLEEFGLKLDKQKKIIHTLKKERNALNEDLTVVTCKTQARKDEKMILRINNLTEELKKSSNVIKKEKEDLRELEVQIRKVSF